MRKRTLSLALAISMAAMSLAGCGGGGTTTATTAAAGGETEAAESEATTEAAKTDDADLSDVEKIIESGKTPAGMHIPILVDEILEVLQIQPGQTGYDATLGYGGHTRRMLAQLQGQGHLYATDVDPIEMEKTRARLASAGFGPELLTIQHRNFADVDQVAPGVLFDFVLADLGVSSMQIDDPARGFSYMQDAPLDMRMDRTDTLTARTVVNEWPQEELRRILWQYGEERYAPAVAGAIVRARDKRPIETTLELDCITRDGLILDVAMVLSTARVRVKEMSGKDLPGGRSAITIRFEVKDVAELESVRTKLLNIRDVVGSRRGQN